MKKIISKLIIILSVLFICISICDISSMDCMKGNCPLQKTIVNSSNYIYGLERGDISCLRINRIPLFYVSLALIILSGVMHIIKNNFKSFLYIVTSIIPTIFVLSTHNYIWFMIMLNIYLMLYVFGENVSKSKIGIITNIVAFLLGIMNCIQLGGHLNIQFDMSDFAIFQMKLIKSSKVILYLFAMWAILYLVLLIKDIVMELNVEVYIKDRNTKEKS